MCNRYTNLKCEGYEELYQFFYKIVVWKNFSVYNCLFWKDAKHGAAAATH